MAGFFAPPEKQQGRRVAGQPVKRELFQQHHEQENLRWAEDLLAQVEDHAASALFREYQRRLGRNQARSANIWLRKSVEQIKAHAARFPLPLRMVANELSRANIAREWANAVAAIIQDQTADFTQVVPVQQLLDAALEPARKWGISPLLPVIKDEANDRQLDMAASALARLQDPEWWERQITKAWRRYAEHVAILVGRVRRGVSPYVSERALQDYQARKRAGAAWLQTMFAINEELGYEVPLAEAVAGSVANPEIRRHELMVRMRGFEDLAEDQGWVGEFYTWTAPSRFHAWTVARNKKTVQNPRYDGANPRQTQHYLCGQWAKARAKLARLGVRFYGFRVVEPHHDGTPHWHLLLFVRPQQRRLLRWVLRRYACEHDKTELANSYKPRFDWRAIDPAKGSATGYIAKYIAKNIDGFKVGIDEETGTAANNTAANVAAWASWWGIRQFQQIGGPSVTVWRELRRLREATANPVLENARIAADRARWADFVLSMGGLELPKSEHLIKLANIIKPAASKYGEDVPKLFGLRTADVTISVNGITTGILIGQAEAQTRHQGWELSRTGLGERSERGSSGGSRAPWSSDNNCTGGSQTAVKDPLSKELALLGLDETDRQRLEAGAVITMDGLFISIRNNTLSVSRERPGLHPAQDPLAEWETREFDAIERDRAARYRRDAQQLLHRGGDIEHWLAAIPAQHQQLALDQVTELVEQMEYEASWQERDAGWGNDEDEGMEAFA
ncbi:replication protein [Zobellella denitrificans]|nr:replication protein [Zobellella denitrificans]